jgi:DNA-binding transcriptional LysR family regulator
VTYLDYEPLRNVRAHPLYHERYMLLTPRGGPLENRAHVTWREAATLPLCLLTRDMQNRRIIDGLFAAGGAPSPRVVGEMNAVLTLVAYVRSSGWSTVVPHTFLAPLDHAEAALSGFVAIPLTEPTASHALGLVTADREPSPAVTEAFVKEVRLADLQAEVDRLPMPAVQNTASLTRKPIESSDGGSALSI